VVWAAMRFLLNAQKQNTRRMRLEQLILLLTRCAVVLLVVLVRRFPASYSAYAGVVLVLTLTARNLDSFERYAMSTFPFLLGLAAATGPEEVERGALVVAAAALTGYAILAFLGLSVP